MSLKKCEKTTNSSQEENKKIDIYIFGLLGAMIILVGIFYLAFYSNLKISFERRDSGIVEKINLYKDGSCIYENNATKLNCNYKRRGNKIYITRILEKDNKIVIELSKYKIDKNILINQLENKTYYKIS